jgi:hypothetical protein
MKKPPSKRVLAAVSALLLAIVAMMAAITGDTGTQPAHQPAPIVTAAPAGPTGPTGPVGELNTQHPEDLRDAGNQGVPQAKIQAGIEAAQRLAETENLPGPTKPIPQGGVQLNPCVGGHYAKNRSAYGGVHPNPVYGTVVHETIGPNVSGWGDIYGTANYLDLIGLSANDIMDAEAHCIHFVDYRYDAYAEGNFNRFYDSIEIVGTGKESRAWWLSQPIFKDHVLANYLVDRLKARGAPLRLVDPNGCTPQLGFTDHNRLECSNDHTDMVGGDPAGAKIDPGFPMDVLVHQVAQGAVIKVKITAHDRKVCARVAAYRGRRRHHLKPTAAGTALFQKRLKHERARGHQCVNGKARQRKK